METAHVALLDKNKHYAKSIWPHETAGYKDYACIMAVFDHRGNIVLVIDREGDDKKGFNPKFKLPGGRQERGELPPETASRELEEETGVNIQPEMLFDGLFCSENRENHFRYWFITIIPEFKNLRERGIEFEEIYVCSYGEVVNDLEFLTAHREGLKLLFDVLYDNA